MIAAHDLASAVAHRHTPPAPLRARRGRHRHLEGPPPPMTSPVVPGPAPARSARQFTRAIYVYHLGSQHGRGTVSQFEVAIRTTVRLSLGQSLDSARAQFPAMPWPGPNVTSAAITTGAAEVESEFGRVWEVVVAVTTKRDATD